MAQRKRREALSYRVVWWGSASLKMCFTRERGGERERFFCSKEIFWWPMVSQRELREAINIYILIDSNFPGRASVQTYNSICRDGLTKTDVHQLKLKHLSEVLIDYVCYPMSGITWTKIFKWKSWNYQGVRQLNPISFFQIHFILVGAEFSCQNRNV